MSGTIWPVDAVSGAPSYTGRMLREAALTPLAAGATAARPFGGISGVRPGTSTAIGSMSGLNYTITPFGGLIDGEASTLAGVYGFAFPANETGTINAQTGTARTDLISVKINDPAEGDAGLPSVTIVYTAGPSPVSPGHGFDLYQVNVPATGGGSPTLTWIGPYTAAAGATLPFLTAAKMTATPGTQVGQRAEVFADTAANNGTYRWNGTSWKPWDSDWIAFTPTIANFTVGSSIVTGRARYVAGIVETEIDIAMGASSAMGTAPTFTTFVNLASDYLADGPLGFGTVTVAGTNYPVEVWRNASGSNTVQAYLRNAAGTYETIGTISALVPGTWGTTGKLQLRFKHRV